MTASPRQLNLSSPTLASNVCHPLTVPANGSFTFDGKLAVASTPGPRPKYLERCGSHLRVRLPPCLLLTDSTAAASLTTAGTAIDGVFLPRLRSFSIELPAPLQSPDIGFVMSDRRLYAISGEDVVWTARWPQTPPRKAIGEHTGGWSDRCATRPQTQPADAARGRSGAEQPVA